MEKLVLTITTISGQRVAAPLERWVQALVLRLPPQELVSLMQMVDGQHPALPPSDLVLAERVPTTIPADPREFTRGRLS